MGQAEASEVDGAAEISDSHPRVCGVRMTKVRKEVDRERLATYEGVTLTQTTFRTDPVTHQFIFPLWTLTPAVTQMMGMDTDLRSSTLIETSTRCSVTVLFVFSIDTVRKPIAPSVDRQTVQPLRHTAIVTVRTLLLVLHYPLSEVACAIQVNVKSLSDVSFSDHFKVTVVFRTADLV